LSSSSWAAVIIDVLNIQNIPRRPDLFRGFLVSTNQVEGLGVGTTVVVVVGATIPDRLPDTKSVASLGVLVERTWVYSDK
jgi:hypothetical protein